MTVTCKICGKKLKNISGLIGHLRTHDITYEEYKKLTEVKKEQCKLCGKEFDNLSNHVKVHGFTDINEYNRFISTHRQDIALLRRYWGKPVSRIIKLKFKRLYGIDL